MKLALMQPYFMPYLGYFSLIAAVDRFVLFDSAQYIRRGWSNRNRLLHPVEGWRYFTVPVRRHARSSAYPDVMVDESEPWRERLTAMLGDFRDAPGYREARELVADAVAPRDTSISELSRHALTATCLRLGLSTPVSRFSELGLSEQARGAPGDWGWILARHLGASTYCNPEAGRALYAEQTYRAQSIELAFVRAKLTPYSQGGRPFVPGLSVLDAILWQGFAGAARLLLDYELLSEAESRRDRLRHLDVPVNDL